MVNLINQKLILGLSLLLATLLFLLNGGLISSAQAQNRCPPGQRELTLFGIPSTGPPNCTSKVPKVTSTTPLLCPKDPPFPPARFLPGVNVKMEEQIPGEKGHRYIDVGPGKFAKLYLNLCFNSKFFIEIHNGERVEVKNTFRRRMVGDLGRVCHNKRCGYIYLADLRPLKPHRPIIPGRRADEDAGEIENLDEKFYVAIPQNKRLLLYSRPDQSGDIVAELSAGTTVKGSKNNLSNKPMWKKICTHKKCGYVIAGYLKQGTPKAIAPQRRRGPKRTMQIAAKEIRVYENADGFSKQLGSIYQGQVVDVLQKVVNEEGVSWTKICMNGCGWVPSEDLRGSLVRTIR